MSNVPKRTYNKNKFAMLIICKIHTYNKYFFIIFIPFDIQNHHNNKFNKL